MKQRVANKIEKKAIETETPKVKPQIVETQKSGRHKKLVIAYQQDNQQKQLVFEPSTQTLFYKAQSLHDSTGKALAAKVDVSAQISLNSLLQLNPDGPRRKTVRPGEYVNEKANIWFSKGKTPTSNAVIKDMPQGWADVLGEDFNPAGHSPQVLAQLLVERGMAKLPEPEVKVAKEPKPKPEKKPRVKKDKVVCDEPKTPKVAKQKTRTIKKEKPLLPMAADLRIRSFDIDMFDNAVAGQNGQAGMTLTFVNSQHQAVCDVVLLAQQGFAAYQVINYHTGTSKTLLYSQKNNPKGARGEKTIEQYNSALPENTTKGLYTHNLQLIYQQQNLQKEKQGLSFLYEFQNVPWQDKSVVPSKIAEADITANLLENGKLYTQLSTEPLVGFKTKLNKNKDIVREKWEEQILPFSTEYIAIDNQADLPHSISQYIRQDDSIFDIGLSFNKAIDVQRKSAQKANNIKRAAGEDVTAEDIKAAHASPMLQLMRNAMMSMLGQDNSTKKMTYYLKSMVDMGKTHFSQQPDNVAKPEAA